MPELPAYSRPTCQTGRGPLAPEKQRQTTRTRSAQGSSCSRRGRKWFDLILTAFPLCFSPARVAAAAAAAAAVHRLAVTLFLYFLSLHPGPSSSHTPLSCVATVFPRVELPKTAAAVAAAAATVPLGGTIRSDRKESLVRSLAQLSALRSPFASRTGLEVMVKRVDDSFSNWKKGVECQFNRLTNRRSTPFTRWPDPPGSLLARRDSEQVQREQ